jgi:clan AA aspartic protease
MIGEVDAAGRALLDLALKPAPEAEDQVITAWIDTGFTGDLVLPLSIIEQLALPFSGAVEAILADGSKVNLKVYVCFIQWFNDLLELEVVANDGACPLLGIGLLRERDLRINYRSRTITVT